jgi:hypothetical protein
MSSTITSVSGYLSVGGTTTNNLAIVDNITLTYCSSKGVLHTDILGNVSTKLIDTDYFTDKSITTAKLADKSVTSEKLADSIFLNGIPRTATASTSDNSTQIATTAFVKTVYTNNSESDETIVGLKTFNKSPIFVPLNTDGIVHNDASGRLSTSLIQTIDIADSVVTFNKLDSALVLPINTTLESSLIGIGVGVGAVAVRHELNKIVTKGFLENQIKEFTEVSSNEHSFNFQIKFLHIDATNIDNSLINHAIPAVFDLNSNIRHIVDVSATIFLPSINGGGRNKEGIYYSVINKSGDSITISTFDVNEFIFNCFVAPDGDNEFILGNNQCLEFISIGIAPNASWLAKYY